MLFFFLHVPNNPFKELILIILKYEMENLDNTYFTDQPKMEDDAHRQETFLALLRTYYKDIRYYCVKQLGKFYGEDVAQEVFAVAWATLPRLRHETSIKSWLFRIAQNQCKKSYRNLHRRRVLTRQFLSDIQNQAHRSSLENHIQTADMESQVTHLTDRFALLRDEERMILNLRYRRGISVPEIAGILGKSEAATRKRLLRALQHLKNLMNDITE